MKVGRIEHVIVYDCEKTARGSEELHIPDMPDGVLDGRLGEICQDRLSRFPLAYAWPALVTVAGTMAPRSPGTLRQSLFAASVGGVHSGKSQAIDNAIKVLGLEPPELQEVMAGSAEGLLARLQDAKGCARLVVVDEMGHLLSKAHIEHASFPFLLNAAFYKTRFDVIAGKGRTLPFDCELSLIGGIVDDQFEELFDVSTVHGLYDRFAFGLCPRPFEYCYRPFEGNAECLNPVSLAVAGEVWELKDQWIKSVPGMTGRIAEIALRVAGICASFNGRRILRPDDLGAAQEFAEYQIRVRELLYPNPGKNLDAQCAFAILERLKKIAPNGEWIPKRDIGRAIHADRFGPSIFRRAGDNLVFNEEIERQFVGTGKKTESWRLAE